MRAMLLAALLTAALFEQVSSQDYVTSTWVYLRRSPSMTSDKLRTLAAGDSLRARTSSLGPQPGWLAVRTMDGKAGWVGEAYVRSLAALAASTGSALLTDSNGAAFARIDASWSKPPIGQSSIWVQTSAVSCGPVGDAADDDGTNLHKNRSDIPDTTHLVTVEAIRALPDTDLWIHTNRKHWTPSDSAKVIPYEGIPLTVEGFFEIVKPQTASAPSGNNTVGESPNCHSWGELDTDWHVALVADPSETEDRSVVVEPTPRSKRNNPGWNPDSVKAIAVRKSPSSARHESTAARVRVTGFLLLDPVHPAHIAGHCSSNCANKKFYRATLWEIHPVTRIEVFRNGAWVDLSPPLP
ncbi:MAG TPA: SH3 domain-containing protein [Gemmatimonadales bacterium]|nr:SH3 domain-containing protein [Gemmatimonadales bacterium]